MLKVNELKQAVITGKASLNALLAEEAKAKGALPALLRAATPDEAAIAAARTAAAAISAKVGSAREALQMEEEALHAEEQRLELEDAALATSPSGRVTVGKDRSAAKPWHSDADGDAAQAEATGLGRWALAVLRASTGRGVDPRLGMKPQDAIKAAALGMNESSGEAGGFAVPTEYAPGIERSMFEVGKVLAAVDSRTIGGNSITYTVAREDSRADGSRQGGVLGYWMDEAATKTASTTLLARLEMKLRKVAALGYITDELLEDAPALGQELQLMFRDELTFQVENKIFRGLGAVTPLGFLQAPCLVTVSAEAGQLAATILPENLSKMWARLPARSQANAAWYVNVDTQPQLDLMSIAAGTGALEPRFVNYGPTGILTIKGRPVIPVEYASTLGTVGDICLCDMKQYRLIRKATGIQEASSIHVAFTTDQTAFRAVYRADGQPVPRTAITPLNGTNTLSPFVVLATRS